ncbi:MAG: hypothetical protein ACTHK7_04750 [Aureliella sp.]
MMSARWSPRILLVVVLCAASFSLRCAGQEKSEASHFHQTASEYQFGIPGQPDLELREKPVMVWSNPAKYNQTGAVFVWMQAGRPQLIGTFYDSVHAGKPRSAVELHSLADAPIAGRFGGAEFWHPANSGLKFAPVGGDMQLASTPQRKLLQFRQISREFGATLTDTDGSKLPLRLLPTPILTYEPQRDAGTDGAIFAFAATGTDPDAFLIIENRKVDGKLALHYAFARFHFRELIGTRGDQTVWHAEPRLEMMANFRNSPGVRGAAYTSFRTK